MSLLVNRARMEGFVALDHAARFHEALVEMFGCRKDGRLKTRVDVVEGGVTAFPQALLKLFSGENFGKLVLDVAKA
jgi:NADPH-dependent curcumin reductase CurA